MTKAEKTRQFIIEKTAPIFNRKGYEGTSLTDMIDATELTKGSIYGNFSSKDDVAMEAFSYNYNLLIKPVEKEAEDKKNAVKKLLLYSDFYRKNYEKIFAAGGCPILNTATEADDTHAFLAESVENVIKSYETSLRRIIEKGIENKEIRKVDAKKYAAILFALIEGGLFLAKSTEKPHFLTDALEHFDKIVQEELKS
jgi:AcrR family transcriptional regulator